MLHRIRRPLTLVLVVVTASLGASACGATDSVKDIREATDIAASGLDTAQYLREVQPQLQAYGATVSRLTLTPPHDARQAKALRTASAQLAAISRELEAIDPDANYRAAHDQLISSVDRSAKVAAKLAVAAEKGTNEPFNTIVSDEWMPAQQEFATAMETATKPIVDAAEKADDNR